MANGREKSAMEFLDSYFETTKCGIVALNSVVNYVQISAPAEIRVYIETAQNDVKRFIKSRAHLWKLIQDSFVEKVDPDLRRLSISVAEFIKLKSAKNNRAAGITLNEISDFLKDQSPIGQNIDQLKYFLESYPNLFSTTENQGNTTVVTKQGMSVIDGIIVFTYLHGYGRIIKLNKSGSFGLIQDDESKEIAVIIVTNKINIDKNQLIQLKSEDRQIKFAAFANQSLQVGQPFYRWRVYKLFATEEGEMEMDQPKLDAVEFGNEIPKSETTAGMEDAWGLLTMPTGLGKSRRRKLKAAEATHFLTGTVAEVKKAWCWIKIDGSNEIGKFRIALVNGGSLSTVDFKKWKADGQRLGFRARSRGDYDPTKKQIYKWKISKIWPVDELDNESMNFDMEAAASVQEPMESDTKATDMVTAALVQEPMDSKPATAPKFAGPVYAGWVEQGGQCGLAAKLREKKKGSKGGQVQPRTFSAMKTTNLGNMHDVIDRYLGMSSTQPNTDSGTAARVKIETYEPPFDNESETCPGSSQDFSATKTVRTRDVECQTEFSEELNTLIRMVNQRPNLVNALKTLIGE